MGLEKWDIRGRGDMDVVGEYHCSINAAMAEPVYIVSDSIM